MIHYIKLAFSSIDVICSGNFVVGWFSRSGVPLHFFTNNRNFKVLPKSFNKMTKIASKIVCQLLVFHLWFLVILSDNHILVFTVLKYIIYKQYICSLNFVCYVYVKFYVISTKLFNCSVFEESCPNYLFLTLFMKNIVNWRSSQEHHQYEAMNCCY